MLTARIYLLTMFVFCPAVAAAQTPATALGPRYTDSLHGFSLRPPAGAAVRRTPGATEKVQFLLHDPATGEIRMRMSVLQGAEKAEVITDLPTYGRKLVAELRATQNFQVDQVANDAVAGKQALVLEGIAGGAEYGVFRRDVWVLTGPNRLLVIRTAGPPAEKQRLIAASKASVATVSLFDPATARQQLEQDLLAGGRRLEQLTEKTITPLLAPRDYWMATIADGRIVGFVHIAERLAAKERTRGFEVRTRSVTCGADARRTILLEEAYCSFDLSVAKWSSFATELDGTVEKSRRQLFGLKQNDLLVVQRVIGPHQTKSRTRNLPAGVYAPKALETLLPRILDRGRPGGYAFAQYNPATEDLDMRTITVVGPRSITLGGRSFPATLLTDQPALGAPAMQVYLDQAGLPLKIVREDGVILQQTTAAAIAERFGAELKMLRPAK